MRIKSKSIGLRVTPEDYTFFTKYCKNEGLTVQKWLENILYNWKKEENEKRKEKRTISTR